jgi:uncharacterized membrane protein YcfT
VFVNHAVIGAGYGDKPGISLMLGIVGIGGVITAGTLMSRIAWMDWLRYLGQHSIVTYLGFFMPMSALIIVAQRLEGMLDIGTMGAIISAISVLCAMVLFWLTRNTVFRFLFSRPAWAHLPGARQKLAEAAG